MIGKAFVKDAKTGRRIAIPLHESLRGSIGDRDIGRYTRYASFAHFSRQSREYWFVQQQRAEEKKKARLFQELKHYEELKALMIEEGLIPEPVYTPVDPELEKNLFIIQQRNRSLRGEPSGVYI